MPLPWLDQPIMLEGMRMSMCDQTPEECAYKAEPFRNWYIADYVYAQGTVAFFAVAIGVCMLVYAVSQAAPLSLSRSSPWQKLQAGLRFLAYRHAKVGSYRTTSIGVSLLLICGAVFFAAMTLGPQPYYWPDISWGGSPPIATRTGWMSLACLPFMLALSTKANMITAITGVSYEKLVIFHKWTGWAMFALALIHTFPFIVVDFQNGIMEASWTGSIFYWSGVVALVAQAYLQFFSLSFIRNRFYEFFKATHLFMAVVFLLFLFFHCDFTLTAAYYFIGAGVLYFLSFFYAQIRTYFEHGTSLRASLDLVAPGTLRITVPVKRNTIWTPGQHVFLRFPSSSVGLLHGMGSHPFTICSIRPLVTSTELHGEKQSQRTGGELVFYAAVRGGITAHLARLESSGSAKESAGANQTQLTLPVRLDGPYGGINSSRPLASYHETLIVVGGAGAAFSLGFVMDFLLLAAETRVPAQRQPELKVVIATRDIELAGWYTAAVDQFAQNNRLPADVGKSIRIVIHQTSTSFPPGSTDSIDPEAKGGIAATERPSAGSSSPSSASGWISGLQISRATGRPSIPAVVRDTAGRHPGGSVAIVACGPGSLLQDVQAAAAEAQVDILGGKKDRPAEVYLHTEHFSW